MKARSTIKGDVMHGLVVTAAMALAGAVIGAIWVLIAPPANSVVAVGRSGRRAHGYVGNDAEHFFDAALMMAGLLFVLGVVSAVLLWQRQSRRGPATVAALFTGGLAAAGAAAGVGAGLARLRYGQTDIGAVPADQKIHYLTEAPAVFFGHTPMQVVVGLLLPSAVAALTYAIIAAASPDDDLGVDAAVAKAVDSRVG